MDPQQPTQTPPLVEPEVPSVQPVQPAPQPIQQPPQQPIQPPVPTPVEIKKEKKSPLLGIVFILLALVLGGAYAANYFGLIKLTKTQPTATTASTPTTASGETAGWVTYSDEKYGFSIKYPASLIVYEEKNNKVDVSSVKIKEKIDSDTFVLWIEKDFIGGWIAKDEQVVPVNVDGEEGKITLWLFGDNTEAGTEEYMKDISLQNYSQASLIATFSHSKANWYIFYQTWNKGERNESEEIQKFKTYLSTFKFIDQTTNISNWKIFNSKTLGIEFKYPSILEKYGTPKETISAAEKGTYLCITFLPKSGFLVKTALAGGFGCNVGDFGLEANSTGFEAGRGGGFTDIQGFEYKNGVVYYNWSVGTEWERQGEIPNDIVVKISKNIVKIKGKNSTEMSIWPSEGEIGAIINTGNATYPGLVLFASLKNGLSENDFDQILTTFKFTVN